MKKYFNYLKVSWKYGKAYRRFLDDKYEKSKILLDEALDIGPPDFILPQIHATKGEVEYNLGNFVEAKRSLSFVRADYENNPSYWEDKNLIDLLERVNYFWNEIQKSET